MQGGACRVPGLSVLSLPARPDVENTLTDPFEQLQVQSIASLTASLSGMSSSLQMALEPFHGAPML